MVQNLVDTHRKKYNFINLCHLASHNQYTQQDQVESQQHSEYHNPWFLAHSEGSSLVIFSGVHGDLACIWKQH